MLWSKMENQKHSWKTIPYKKLLKKGVISVKKEKYNGSFVVKVPKKKKKKFCPTNEASISIQYRRKAQSFRNIPADKRNRRADI